ncbi:MAG: hypothetical protein IJU36_03290 [Paludibacteraceae bacterium]|nr:hypothetical protein [Paludibacteraceae bacterium]
MFGCGVVSAADSDTMRVEHEDILRVHFGGMWLQDQYLSPLLYSGMQVGIGNEWWQPMRRHPHWSHVGQVDARFAWIYSSAKNNLVYALQLQGGWGAYYAWQWRDPSISLILGPYLNVDFAPRMHGREVNKPYSMDLAADVCALAGVTYTVRAGKVDLRLRYLIRANLFGVDFMPDYWQSYYELTEGVRGNIRFSGMWNHRLLRHELTLDIRCPHSTWRVGIAHAYLEYGAGNMWFSREQVEAIVGTCFHYRIQPSKPFDVW